MSGTVTDCRERYFCCGVVVRHAEYYRCALVFFFQAEDGIRDLVRSRGLGDVYKRQGRAMASHLRRGVLVTLESSTYPGTTDEDLRKVLELSLIHI